MSEITPNTPNPVREDAYKQQLATKLGIDPQYIPGSPIWHSEEEIAAIAEMFSNMAGSSGGGVFVVNETYVGNTGTLDKTWQEIHDAAVGGQMVVSRFTNEDGTFCRYLSSVESSGSDYNVDFFNPGPDTIVNWYTNSANGYPVVQE